MKTIRVQLQGGLGNQLFIWTMAHDICAKTGRKVQLEFVKDRHQRIDRPIEIENLLEFCQHEVSINQTSWLGYLFRIIDKSGSYSLAFKDLLKRWLGVYDCKDPYEVPDFTDRVPRIIRGYFQSFSLVERNCKSIGKELSLALEQEQMVNAVIPDLVMHIRRGDTREISKTWGVLSTNYYVKQININDSMTICLDDKAEISNLEPHFPKAKFLTPENSTTWQTLKILSQARTLIIANSTLSWWGAWIKSLDNPEKVYFPDSWRPDDSKSIESLVITSAHLIKSEFEV